MDERNRLLLTTDSQYKKNNLDFLFVVSNHLRMSHLKAYIYIFKMYFFLYLKLCMILQVGGLVNLLIGIAAAVEVQFVERESKNGKLDLWYQ